MARLSHGTLSAPYCALDVSAWLWFAHSRRLRAISASMRGRRVCRAARSLTSSQTPTPFSSLVWSGGVVFLCGDLDVRALVDGPGGRGERRPLL